MKLKIKILVNVNANALKDIAHLFAAIIIVLIAYAVAKIAIVIMNAVNSVINLLDQFYV